MNLTKHINSLLKYHECVIIPEFGAFISNYKPAEFNAVKNTFSPPSKTVVFNSQIKNNDGLLINEIAEKESVEHHQAEVSIMNFVDRLFDTLNKSEKFEVEEIGIFSMNKSGSIIFTSYDDFELIEAYGLSEISYPTLRETSPAFNTRPAVQALNRKKDIIKIAASVALIIALSALPTGLKKTTLQSSVLNPANFMATEEPAQIVAEEIIEETTAVDFVAENASVKPFILVGGSFKVFENASSYQNDLINHGYGSEIMELDNGLFRVVIDSYNNQIEAETAMIEFQSENRGSKAWVGKR